ncbi:RNA-binding protein, putative [Bodo saltans]|uniref:RNA-binding protein, putative n=1 Tax=Bodo saltans TaxID=75058 RepID=A0A0S4JEI3_BODSA|nr:RNA-binding protein, putative [Bodo saltans]|eukprot:CUG89781.1 RNA-binding protein, putative [Bodo saltans]
MCDFVEDVVGIPKREVSISSCDSDPLEYRHRGGLRSSQSSAYGGSDDGSDDDLETKSCGGDSVVSIASSSRSGGGGGGGRDRRFHAMEAMDIQELAADLLGRPAGAVGEGGDAEQSSAATDPLPPLEAINIDHVSEAPVAVIESVIVSSSTVVADKRPDALVVDAGTRICLSDGTIVGIVATVLGPISSCAYAIACRPGAIADLALEDRIGEGTLLHYDVTKQVVLYDPALQCDSGKGTDASFVQDEELPLGTRPDFSDDEDERAWKRRRRENAAAGNSASAAADRQQIAADRKMLAQMQAQSAKKISPQQNNAGGGTHQPLAAVIDEVEVVSAVCDSGKGTDASFVQDEELPLGTRPDFSDDEDERAWKRRRRENAAAGNSASAAADRQQIAADRKMLAQMQAQSAKKISPQQNNAGGGTHQPLAAVIDEVEVVSSSDSEVEFDDEGNMVAYRPRRRKRGL